MRTSLLLLVLTGLLAFAASAQDVRVATAYSYPLLPGSALDSVLWDGAHVRGCAFSDDADGDGKAEIAITNYDGRVHIFEVVGDDSIELVWTSPPAAVGGGSTPRSVIFGDLDTDGREEVIFQVSNDGIYIFEWDGVVGSHNFGTLPSQTIISPPLGALIGSVEHMEVLDVDGDGQNELLITHNSAPNENDRFYIISALGGWDTDNPGFSSFDVEFEGIRTNMGTYGMSAGTPYAMIPADFDGTGNKEILLHGWNLKNVVPMTVPAANTYHLADTANGKQNFYLSGPDDNVSLFGGMAYDIDNDGREEVYLPTWYGSSVSENSTKIHMVFYDPGSNTSEIDSANVQTFDLRSVTGDPDPDQAYSANTLGYGYGDLDGNGKENLYFSGIYFGGDLGFNIVSMEYQGGDKKDPANWTLSMVYKGQPDIIESITIRDSLGTVDTTVVSWAAQVAHMYGKNTDFDKDGKQDLLLPMQGWFNVHMDSTTTTRLTWNQGSSSYDTVTTVAPNPKRWVFRVLEGSPVTGVKPIDLTVITPEDYVLEQNYPNPFNPETTIRFTLPMAKQISLVVYDMLGQEVRTLIAGQPYQPGTHQVVWDGTNDNGHPVASGNYVYTLKFGNFTKTAKMTLLR
jgi:hypothetical protein